MSATVIIVLVVSMILLFVSMVLAAMASSDAQKKNLQDAQKYSMWSAVVSGLSIALLIVVLIMYIYSERLATHAYSALERVQGSLRPYTTQPQAVEMTAL
jgi:hypothetical protein